jgi:hypothetical protein
MAVEARTADTASTASTSTSVKPGSGGRRPWQARPLPERVVFLPMPGI